MPLFMLRRSPRPPLAAASLAALRRSPRSPLAAFPPWPCSAAGRVPALAAASLLAALAAGALWPAAAGAQPTAFPAAPTGLTAQAGAQTAFPAAPTGLTAQAGDGQVRLSWDALAGASSYLYQQDSGDWLGAGPDTSHTVTGLQNGTEYTFRVRAQGPGILPRQGAASAPVTATPQAPAGPPEVSLMVSPNPASEGSPVAVTVLLSRALDADAAIPVTVTRISSEAGDHGVISSIPVIAGQRTGMGSLSTLIDDDGDDETFSVAIDTAALPSEVVAGAPVSQTVTVVDIRSAAGLAEARAWPAAPGRFAVHAGDGQATLSWDELGGAVAYQYRQDSGDWVDVGADTSQVVTGLANGTQYRFSARGVGLGHEPYGAATDAVSATPRAAGSESVSLSAAPNPATEGSPVAVTVTLSAAPASNVAVPVSVARVSSEAGDHGSISSITVTAGQTTGTGTITTQIDTDRDDETFTVALNTAALPAQLTAANPTSATVTITDMTLAAPSGLAAEAADGRVTLSWNALSGATGYEVQRDSGTWAGVGDVTTWTVTGLDNGTEYRFRVRAMQQAFPGAATDAAAATPTAAAPDPPAAVSVVHHGASLYAQWPPAGGADRYDVEYRARSDAAWARAATGQQLRFLTLAVPDSSKSYLVRVRATNDHGAGGWTGSAPAAPPRPDPVGLVSLRHNGDSLHASWGGAARADRYDVEYRAQGAAAWRPAAADHAATSLTIGGIDATKSYTVRVLAKNDAGGARDGASDRSWTSSEPAAPSARPGPQPPPSVSVTHNGRDLSVSWPTARYAATYRVEYSRDSGRTWRPATLQAVESLSLTIHSVNAADAYTVRVKAYNDHGASAWTTSAATAPAAPDPPRLLVRAHTDRLTVFVSKGPRATTLEVEHSSDGGATWTAARAASIVHITGIDPAITSVRARGGNASGHSAWTTWSPPEQEQTLPAAPDAPASVSVARSAGALSVSWEASAGASGYDVEYQAAGASTWTSAATGHASTSLTISGVDSATSYTVRVKANNDGGQSDWTTSAPAPPAAPDAPASVSATHNGDTLTVSWGAPARASGYDVEYQAAGASSWTSAATDHASASLTISGVDSATSYTVRVKANNAGGASDWTTSASASPPPAALAAPANVTVTESFGRANVNWDGSAGATGYEYRLKAQGADAWGRWWHINGGGDKSIQLRPSQQRPLEPGANYVVQVRAVQNANGSTRYSTPTAEVEFTMPG